MNFKLKKTVRAILGATQFSAMFIVAAIYLGGEPANTRLLVQGMVAGVIFYFLFERNVTYKDDPIK